MREDEDIGDDWGIWRRGLGQTASQSLFHFHDIDIIKYKRLKFLGAKNDGNDKRPAQGS